MNSLYAPQVRGGDWAEQSQSGAILPVDWLRGAPCFAKMAFSSPIDDVEVGLLPGFF
jgi:hypothetical protein